MLKLLLGDPNTRKLKRYQPIVEEINFLEEEISKLTDEELRRETYNLKSKISSELDFKKQKELLEEFPKAEKVIFPASGHASYAEEPLLFNQQISSPWAIESIKKCKAIYTQDKIDFVIGSDLIADISSWKNFYQIHQEVKLLIIKREGYPIELNTLKMLEKYKVIFEISSLNIPNISSSTVRLNKNYSNLPSSLIDIVRKNNLYVSP